MKIIDLRLDQVRMFQETVSLLFEGFRSLGAAAWPDLDISGAFQEVQESMGLDRISRIAVTDEGKVVGWIAGASGYNGNAWELHPLVVHPDQRGHGIGGALVRDFEQQAKQRGGITIYLGADDEDNRTSLGGVDLYPNVLPHLAQVKNLRHHPFEFYQKLGYAVVGVIPDANGPGKPDILMAKRVEGKKNQAS